VEVFADYQCEFCKQFMEAFLSLKTKEKMIYHFLPLHQHEWAQLAAEEAACVRSQDEEAFWIVTASIYRQQASISSASLPPMVDQAVSSRPQVSLESLHECMRTHKGEPIVSQDRSSAAERGIHATPTVFINGKQFYWRGQIDELELAMEVASRESGTVSAGKSSN
jgi:protein-disulfide isomerase